MKKVRIYVTKEDIKLGCKGNINSCPLALAIGRKFKQTVPSVWKNIFFWSVKGYKEKCLYKMSTPAKAFSFANAFDQGSQVKPFQFTIEVPECLIQQ